MPSQKVVTTKVKMQSHIHTSVDDHFLRLARSHIDKRILGVLLGKRDATGVVDVTNSFAVPFDEDVNDKSVWFLDHDYLELMYKKFKKINASEKVVGWYHSGGELQQNDIAINELIRRYCPNTVLVIIDVKSADLPSSTKAYKTVEEVHDDGNPTTRTFEEVPREIYVDKMVVQDIFIGMENIVQENLSQQVRRQRKAIQELKEKIRAGRFTSND